MTARISLCEIDGITPAARDNRHSSCEPRDDADTPPRSRRSADGGAYTSRAHSGRRAKLVRSNRVAPSRLHVRVANRVLDDHGGYGCESRHSSMLEPRATLRLANITP